MGEAVNDPLNINKMFPRANVDRRGNILGENGNPICQKSDRHGHVEDGEMYRHSGKHGSLANGATTDHIISIVGQDCHLITAHADIQQSPVTGPVFIYIYESPTYSAIGTAASVINANRNYSDNPANPLIYEAPTITAVGTLLHTKMITGSIQGGKTEPDEIEVILKAGLKYLVRVSNESGSSVSEHTVAMDLYPETVPAPLP